MNKNVLFWILAFVITVASAYYQRVTGPTYPLSGKIKLANEEIKYKLDRTHSGFSNQQVKLYVKDKNVSGNIFWKRYKTDDEWTKVEMIRRNDSLVAEMPAQPSAGKLMYKVSLNANGQEFSLSEQPVVIRFKGDVPLWILIPHVFFMFSSMLLSTRTGLEIFNDAVKAKKLMFVTLSFLLLGGFLFGPIVQKYAFGEFWTGVPFGYDLTDNKTLIALVGWIIAAVMFLKKKNEKFWITFAAVLMLVIFLIPHSILGSELDYKKLDKEKTKVENVK
ncbi:MAG: hypothetical protein M0P61_09530 [Ignavibacteriaceae bacterium]|jgi:hypothetical protein|nr:hypothetical protein [Ignavibacteriaceae bacterium]